VTSVVVGTRPAADPRPARTRPGRTFLRLADLLDPGNAYAQDVDGIVVRDSDGVHLSSAAVEDVMAPALLSEIVALGNQTR